MNMFKSRRKAKEQSDTLEALTGRQSPPQLMKSGKTLHRKNKNTAETNKPGLDLTTALPTDNDFRTSLLMPNLSARFSMLREQDDPNTKLGKASDDSVLFPKRASRLNLFTQPTLPDLAEVESIRSFRPPFAERDRANSLGDGYDSDGGSMMGRSRPGEGNNLFGGRQKLYRIPTGSTRNLADGEGAVPGRHVYEHDVSLSLFQQYRRREKEQRESEDENSLSAPTNDTCDEASSPATAFSRDRGTKSSTNSIPRRASTAATSVVSESPILGNSEIENVASKSSDGFASSESPSKPASPVVPKCREEPARPNRILSQSKSSANIGERFRRPGGVFVSAPNRNISSPTRMAPNQPLDFGFKTESRSESASGRHMTDSPTPIQSENDVLASSLQPNDRGKATAMGLFNKPAREFDEQQFNQRQKQMHEGRMSPMSTNSRSDSRASIDVKMRQSPESADESTTDRTSTPQVPPTISTSSSPAPSIGRVSKASGRSTPPRPRSKSSASATATANVKARVESLIRKKNAELAALEAEKLGTADAASESRDESAFNDDESDYEDVVETNESRTNSSKVDEADIHPAFRNSHRVSDGQSRKSNHSNFSRTRSVFDEDKKLQVPVLEEPADSQPSFGLSGLIRTHLRHESDKSSIMLPNDLNMNIVPARDSSRTGSVISTNKTVADSFRSDYFSLDERKSLATSPISQAPLTPTTAMSQTAQQFLSNAQALINSEAPITPTTAMSQTAKQFLSQAMDIKNSTDNDQNHDARNEKSWHDEVEPTHRRGGSSETTKERREFDEDLAERRRKIREGLKSVTERDRSQSPAHPVRGQAVAMQAFVQPRSVTDPQKIKAMKTLGLESPNLVDEEMGRNGMGSKDTRGRPLDTMAANRNGPTYARFGRDQNKIPPRSVTPPASRFGRERSNSKGERSKSRPRPREISNPPLPPNRSMTSDSVEQDETKKIGLSSRLPPPVPNADHIVRTSPRPSPISPTAPSDAFSDSNRPSPGFASGNRSASASSGRSTPTGPFGRKRSVTKTMISEPTFVSSTSSVPLVHLPHNVSNPTSPPPLPLMNPRRRGTAGGDKPIPPPINAVFTRSPPLETVPASPIVFDFDDKVESTGPNSPSPRKLRKANSEGGSMAAKARQQAMAADLAQENLLHPVLPMFPNRSTTTLDTRGDGTMF